LIVPSLYWAYAAVASPQSAARAIAKIAEDRIASSLLSTKIGLQFFPIRLDGRIGDHVDDAAMT
jgi:hypothetical protein